MQLNPGGVKTAGYYGSTPHLRAALTSGTTPPLSPPPVASPIYSTYDTSADRCSAPTVGRGVGVAPGGAYLLANDNTAANTPAASEQRQALFFKDAASLSPTRAGAMNLNIKDPDTKDMKTNMSIGNASDAGTPGSGTILAAAVQAGLLSVHRSPTGGGHVDPSPILSPHLNTSPGPSQHNSPSAPGNTGERGTSDRSPPRGVGGYYDWVEAKLEAYRSESALYKKEIQRLKATLAEVEVARRREERVGATGRAEDAATIERLEQMIVSLRQEAQNVLREHADMSTKYGNEVKRRQEGERRMREELAGLEGERDKLRLAVARAESEASLLRDRLEHESERSRIREKDGAAEINQVAAVFATEKRRRADEYERQMAALKDELRGERGRADEAEAAARSAAAEVRLLSCKVEGANAAAESREKLHEQELAEAEAKQRALEEQVRALGAAITSLDAERTELVGQLKVQIETSERLLDKSSKLEAKLGQSEADDSLHRGRLDAVYADLRATQAALAEARSERESAKVQVAQLEEELVDARRRLEQRGQLSTADHMYTAEIQARCDAATRRAADEAAEASALREQLTAAETREKALIAERDLATATIAKMERERARNAADFASRLEESRQEAQRAAAVAAREADKALNEAVAAEARRGAEAARLAAERAASDPRVLRATELERRVQDLQRQLDTALDDNNRLSQEAAWSARRDATLLRQREAELSEARAKSEAATAGRLSAEEEAAESKLRAVAASNSALALLQASETALRDLLSRVANLSAARLHADYLLAARSRSETYSLRQQLRNVILERDAARDEVEMSRVKLAGVSEALQQESGIGRELLFRLHGYAAGNNRCTENESAITGDGLNSSLTHNKRFTPRRQIDALVDVTASPGGVISAGTYIDLTDAVPGCPLAAAGHTTGSPEADDFVLSTRWDLVSELCKQDVRLETAAQVTNGLYQTWEPIAKMIPDGEQAGDMGAAPVSIPAECLSRLSNAVLDTIELVKDTARGHSELCRRYMTDTERVLLAQSRALGCRGDRAESGLEAGTSTEDTVIAAQGISPLSGRLSAPH